MPRKREAGFSVASTVQRCQPPLSLSMLVGTLHFLSSLFSLSPALKVYCILSERTSKILVSASHLPAIPALSKG